MINAIIILTVVFIVLVAYLVDEWEIRRARKRIKALGVFCQTGVYRTGENGDIECIPFEELWKVTQ